VHSAVASTLWAVGKRQQALMEWRAAVETTTGVFDVALQTALTSGARPEELAVLAGGDPERLIRTTSFLLSRGKPAAARAVLSLASAAGAPELQTSLIQAGLDIQSGDPEKALKSLAVARKLAPQDARVFLLLGQAKLLAGRVDEALADLDTGIGMNPHDLSLLRSRLSLIMSQQKWFLAKGALEGLEVGLAEARLPTTEVHLAAARYFATLREYAKATSEYNLVLAQDPANAGAWAEMGALWETAGRMVPALEAYRQANSVSPGNPAVVAAIDRLTSRIQTIRAGAGLLP
jgi:tetratricopeptide (TPR) repeat protein